MATPTPVGHRRRQLINASMLHGGEVRSAVLKAWIGISLVHCRFIDSAMAHVKPRAGHGVKSTARRCAPPLQGWLVPVPDPVASSGDHRSNANSGTPPATAFTKMNGKRRGGEMLS